MYRVWTRNAFGNQLIMTDWTTKAKCRRFILGRWGHWPPFASISKAKDRETFIRYNGE